MATITQFEDLQIWQPARHQDKLLQKTIHSTSLARDYELKWQMSASCGSVMDNIAEGFERSGNNELKHFLLIAKGSNGEYRSQLYRAFDRNHFTKEQFQILYDHNLKLGNKIMSYIMYLKSSNYRGMREKKHGS